MLVGRSLHFFHSVLVICLFALPSAAQSEIELSIYGGPQTTYDSTIRSVTLGNDSVDWQSKPFAMPPYYGLRGTWWSDGPLGYGVDFTHAKAYADDPARYGYDSLNFSHGLNILTADIWYRFNAIGRVTPYVGAGLGVAIPHVEVQPIGRPATYEYQLAGPTVSLVIGASVPISPNWSVFTEYKGNYSQLGVKLNSGDRLNANIFTDALNLGVSVRF